MKLLRLTQFCAVVSVRTASGLKLVVSKFPLKLKDLVEDENGEDTTGGGSASAAAGADTTGGESASAAAGVDTTGGGSTSAAEDTCPDDDPGDEFQWPLSV